MIMKGIRPQETQRDQNPLPCFFLWHPATAGTNAQGAKRKASGGNAGYVAARGFTINASAVLNQPRAVIPVVPKIAERTARTVFQKRPVFGL